MSLGILPAVILLFSCATSVPTEKDMNQNTVDMFPKAQKDEIQHIIALPVLDNEEAHKVEIFVTKTMEVDCNYHLLSGRIEEKELRGWGCNYYLFKTNGNVISTMMACPDNSLTKKDVASESQLLNYNSKLPIVIYTPAGYKVKYKLWNASSEVKTAQPVMNAQNE